MLPHSKKMPPHTPLITTSFSKPASVSTNSHGMALIGRIEKKALDSYIYPVDQVDYMVGGCSIRWLNVKNTKTAIAYYRETFPFLTESVMIHMAVVDLERKIIVACRRENSIKISAIMV
jgi:hypothetical protein